MTGRSLRQFPLVQGPSNPAGLNPEQAREPRFVKVQPEGVSTVTAVGTYPLPVLGAQGSGHTLRSALGHVVYPYLMPGFSGVGNGNANRNARIPA